MNVATTILARGFASLLPADLGRRVKLAVKEVERERAYARAYEAAGWGGRWTPKATMPAPTSEGLNAFVTLGQRAAFMLANDPYVAAIGNAMRADIGGPDGPSLQHPDAAIVRAWNERFFAGCDAEGKCTLAHFLERIITSWLVYGETFVMLRVDPDTGALKLLLIPVTQVDASYSEDFGDRGYAVTGIWLARNGPALRYRVWRDAPDNPVTQSAEASWIDAADMVHLADWQFPGQVRGISPLAPVLTRALEIDAAEDAGLMLQKVAALLSVFLSDPSGSIDLAAMTKPGGLFADGMKPGAVHITPDGVTPTVVNPPKSDSLVDFTKHMVRSLATGVGLPAWQVSGDLSDVNFSSARLGKLNWQRRAESLQRNLLVGQFLDPVFRRWVALETIAGRLNVDLDRLAPPTWLFPGWPAVDVLKETEADVLAVSAGIKSRAEVISANGRDPEAVRAEIKADPTPPPAAPAQAPRSAQNG